jgi:hypothetical protein
LRGAVILPDALSEPVGETYIVAQKERGRHVTANRKKNVDFISERLEERKR